MLSRLSIQNYALIQQLDIAWQADLNIITGETGAGKSILLGALGLLQGNRADTKVLYDESKKCIVEGTFTLDEANFKPYFDGLDMDFEPKTTIRREINADGKSRAFVNDSPVNLSDLKLLAANLIDIHSQHQTLELNKENFQLSVLDALAKNDDKLKQYKAELSKYNALNKEINQLKANADANRKEFDFLSFQYNELADAKIQPNEIEEKEAELNALQHAEDIKLSLSQSINLMDNEVGGILQNLKQTEQALAQASKYMPDINDYNTRIKATLTELKDILSDLESRAEAINYDPAYISVLSDRLNILNSLLQKHRINTTTALLQLQEALNLQLSQIGNADDNIAELEKKILAQKAVVQALALSISQARNTVIPEVQNTIIQMLIDLGMPNAVLQIQLNFTSENFNSLGSDEVSFLFTANKGMAPQPLDKVASGGELSRLMLSIKALLARHKALPSVVFDEIDTGISGEVAQKMGVILEKLSASLQIITITHLPQIASRGKHHYFVKKQETESKTLTQIVKLTDNERITEIAKMLSGNNPTESALANARELVGVN